jgi:hypothetical protein
MSDGRRRADSWAPSSRRVDGYDSDIEYEYFDPRDYEGKPNRGNTFPAEPYETDTYRRNPHNGLPSPY